MIHTIRKKLYLLGYAIIFYGIIQFGYFIYISYHIGHDILNNKERTIIDANSVRTIGKSQFNYTNIILVILFYLVCSIVPILLGTYNDKKGNKKRIDSVIK